jgi:hypothetical protein
MGVIQPHRTTVAIPLHASARWLDVVGANIDRLSGHAHVVVSDPTGLDDTLQRLRSGREHLEGIEWRTSPTAPGWVAHCNALLAEAATTEYFMWLPHDDDVDADWIRESEAALDADPSAVLAVGQTEAVGEQGSIGLLEIDPRTGHPDREVRLGAVADIWIDGDLSTLGVAFRGVFRRLGAPHLPQLDDVGSWADLVWAGAFLNRGPFVAIPARYVKRYHDANTHSTWAALRGTSELREVLLPELLEQLPAATALRILGVRWDRERRRLEGEIATVSHLGAERAAAITDEYTSSRSWQLTLPFRRISQLLRGR